MYESQLNNFINELMTSIDKVLIHDGMLEISIVRYMIKEGHDHGVKCAMADYAWHNGDGGSKKGQLIDTHA